MEKNAISLTTSAYPLGPVCRRYVQKLSDALAVSASGIPFYHHCSAILIFKIRAVFDAALANIKNESAYTRHNGGRGDRIRPVRTGILWFWHGLAISSIAE